ncbi:hypothetical protein QQ054_04545 [Oscillatoria amoena NRMC-F 0135]|nr:hypothetical protein [Oscillatoria amoena NRMC-F 0135]
MIVRSAISVIICQCFLAVALLADPGRELQALIDAVPEGGTLTLDDGVYHGTFRVQRPMTIRAANPGKVTLTNAHPHPLEFRADERAPGLYVAEVQHRVRWVMVGSRNLYNYITLDDLVTFTARPAHTRLREPASGLFEEGFAWEDGRLFVRLLDHADIRRERVRVNSDRMDGWSYFLKDNGTTATQSYVRPATQPVMLHYEGQPDRELLLPDDLGVIVSIESDRVTLEGLRIELAPDVGVDVKWGRDVVIRDCYFEGFQYGINTGERCIGLTVEHCEFSGGGALHPVSGPATGGVGQAMAGDLFLGPGDQRDRAEGTGFHFSAQLHL